MNVVSIDSLTKHPGESVTIRGWVYHLRAKGKLAFLVLRDGSGIAQCVFVKSEVDDATFDEAQRLSMESAIEITGEVRLDARAPGGAEIGVRAMKTYQKAAADFPIQPKEHGTGFLMENRHLWLRSRKPWACLRVRDAVIRSIRGFFYERGFVNIDSPIFTPAACEGTSTLFEVEYFDEKAYLTQSGQLYAEAAAMAFGKVFTFGPTFRAEKSKTRRHLTEFWMIEPEVAFAELNDIMDLAEAMLCHIVKSVLAERREELTILERDITKLEKIVPPFPRLSYTDAVDLLKQKGLPFEYGGDLGAPDETAIGENYDRPVMVHRYPHEVKAFYMKRDPQDSRFALCVDVLAPEGYGEIIGGSQREENLDILEGRIADHKLPREAFAWYLDLRRFGSVPHSGFGMGLERCVAWLTGVDHLRECIPFPRMLYRIYP
ncbi:MAG: asparagine--tRNA ligase [Planctomycetes bacterium]|nr:asparagine--tRNA ligase [Planctomycetota bacterium]